MDLASWASSRRISWWRAAQWGVPSMNSDPQLLVRHGVLLPPGIVARAPKSTAKTAPVVESWQARQSRFRRVAWGVSGALLLLLAAGVVARGRAEEAPVASPQDASALRASATKSIPVPTVISVTSKRRAPGSAPPSAAPLEPAPSLAAPLAVVAPPIVSARLASEKIAASESGTKAERLGVSKPQSLSVPAGAFDAPFVPPAD